MTIRIQSVHAPDVAEVLVLLDEYKTFLGADLEREAFEAEIAALPGDYSPPSGRLLIARDDSHAAGCVAMRPIGGERCEMKRLFVRPGFRASGVGRLLVEHVIAEARAIGYAQMCLDTLPYMTSAQKLYESLGFRDIAPYRHNPTPGTRYLGLDLT